MLTHELPQDASAPRSHAGRAPKNTSSSRAPTTTSGVAHSAVDRSARRRTRPAPGRRGGCRSRAGRRQRRRDLGPERSAQTETRTGPERPAVRRQALCGPSRKSESHAAVLVNGQRTFQAAESRTVSRADAASSANGLRHDGQAEPERTLREARCAWRPAWNTTTASAPAAASSSRGRDVARPANRSGNALRRSGEVVTRRGTHLRRAREQRRVEVPSAEPVPSQTEMRTASPVPMQFTGTVKPAAQL